jgi:methylated-DNA-[protein]-cysteine S-methyltransferase
MNPMTEKQLERMLRNAPAGADLERAVEGVLARAEKDGLIDVAYTEIDSPFGKMLIAGSERGILWVAFPHREWDELLDQIAAQISPRVLEAPERLDEPRRQLDEYFEGKRREFDLPLDWRLTHGFQKRAQHAIARIPYGETRNYAWIAEKAGNPRAYRAAGTACGANHLPPIVPCHRVVPASGGIGNYGGGPEMKKALLELEGAL